MTDALLAERPANVSADRVVDLDIYRPLADGLDFQQDWRGWQEKGLPSVVWTPHNGGHWVALTGPLVERVLSDSDYFSNNTVLVPKDTAGEAYRLVPLSLDPPEHRPFRNLLNDNLSPKALTGVDQTIRALAVELIEGFKPAGRCNFITDFAEKLPLRIFMQIVDLPMTDMPKLKHLADQFTRPDGSLTYPEVSQLFRDYVNPIIAERRGSDRQDMITRMVSGKVGDRDLTDVEAANMCIQVLVGGLDTVVNFMGFTMQFLARDADLRKLLASDPSRIGEAVMEFLRRFPLVASGREVRQDFEFEGASLKAGDMILAPTPLHGLDETINKDAFAFDINRTGRRHVTFGTGSHTCPGAHLARMETRIVLEEWLARIPDFDIAPGTELSFGGGVVGTVHPFDLVWKS
jgi:camphor 5-monooxygenase